MNQAIAPRSPRFSLALAVLAGAVAGILGARLSTQPASAPPASSAAPAPPDTSPVVLRAGDETMTLNEFEERWRQLSPADQSFHGAMAREQGLPSAKEHFLGEIEDELLLAREARRRGLDARADVRAAVRATGNRIVSRPLLAQEVRRAAVPRSEIEAFYRAHADRFGEPERVRMSEIIVTSTSSGQGDDTPDAASARAKAERLRARAIAGEDFAALAREGSEAPSAQYGGLVGWVTAGRLSRAWEDKALALQPGEVSEILEIPEGFAILKAGEKQPTTIPPLEDVEAQIIDELLADDEGALQRRYNVFVGQLRASEKPERHPELLRQDAPVPASGDAPAGPTSDGGAAGPSGR